MIDDARNHEREEELWSLYLRSAYFRIATCSGKQCAWMWLFNSRIENIVGEIPLSKQKGGSYQRYGS
jgi:hypothetical protein